MSPFEICTESSYSLLPLKPEHHLINVVFFIAGTVGVFCVVNVQAFRRLSIESIGRAKKSNEPLIMVERVDLGDIEVVTAPFQLNEYLLVGVKAVESISHAGKGDGRV
jgi:hypothetical protein